MFAKNHILPFQEQPLVPLPTRVVAEIEAVNNPHTVSQWNCTINTSQGGTGSHYQPGIGSRAMVLLVKSRNVPSIVF